MARQLIKWHPIYIDLIEGSGERLVIAIAGGTTEEVRVKRIEGFHEAFGPEVEAVLAATRPMLNAVTEALRNGSIDLLSSADALGPGLFVGEARQIMTADIDATLEAAARISSSVFNAWLPDERASQTQNHIAPKIYSLRIHRERISEKLTQIPSQLSNPRPFDERAQASPGGLRSKLIGLWLHRIGVSERAAETAKNSQTEADSAEKLTVSKNGIAQSILESHYRWRIASAEFTENRRMVVELTSVQEGMKEIDELIEELVNQAMRLKLANATMRTASGDQVGKLDFTKAERIARRANEVTEHIRKQGHSIQMFMEQFMAELDTTFDETQPVHDYGPVAVSAVDEQSSTTQGTSDATQSLSTIH